MVQEKSDQIQTHLLRYFVRFYRHLGGIPVHWPSAHNRTVLTILHPAWLNAFVLYGLCAMDPYSITSGSAWLKSHLKPLVALVIQLNGRMLHPILYLIHTVQLQRIGVPLLGLLDSELIHRVYGNQSRRCSCVTCLSVLCMFSGAFTVFHWGHLSMTGDDPIHKVVSALCLFAIHQQQCVVLGSLHYVKFATAKSLEGLLLESDIETTVKHVRQLAKLNAQLHRLLSVSLAAVWFKFTMDSITSVCLLSAMGRDFGIVGFVYAICYPIYIVSLDRRIDQALARLLAKLLKTQQQKRKKSASLEIAVKPPKSSPLELYLKQFSRQYGPLFRMRVFHLCTFDAAFVLTVALFIFNYSVLIIQTNATSRVGQ